MHQSREDSMDESEVTVTLDFLLSPALSATLAGCT